MSTSLTRPKPRRLLAALCGALLAFFVSVPSLAADYTVPGFGVSSMPDFDQRRQPGPLFFDGQQWISIPPGLPNNGAMYCVPTASIDVMAYLTHHGYPDAMPGGPANWQSPAQYDAVTEALQEMGVYMETHPTSGTSGKGRSGTQEWIDDHIGPDTIIVDSKWASKSYAPNVWELNAAAQDGQIVIMNVGWFTAQPGGQWLRTGGHQTVITHLIENDGYFTDTCQVGFRDPGSGGDSMMTQSTFSSRINDIEYEFGIFADDDDDIEYYNRTMTKLVGYGNQGFISGYYTFSGVFGVGPNGPGLDIYNPYGFTFDPNPSFQSLPSSDGLQIEAVAIHPSKRYVYYTVRDASGAQVPGIRCVERRTGETTVPLPGVSVDRFIFNGGDLVYSIEGTCVVARDLHLGGDVIGSQCLPLAIDDVAFDNVFNRVLAASAAQWSALVMSEELDTAEVVALPSTLDLSGEIFLSSCPKSGDYWVRSSGSSWVYRLRYEPATDPATGGTGGGGIGGGILNVVESFSDPELVGATGLEATLGQRLYWTKGGIVRLHVRDGSGGWVESTDSPFAGVEATGRFVVARPADNTDIEYRSRLNNVLPVLDDLFERGDCNADSAYDIGDAIATLSFLFSGATTPVCEDACDSNDDGAVDIGDAIFTLASLFSGGISPTQPFGECGEDPTPDSLECVMGSCP